MTDTMMLLLFKVIFITNVTHDQCHLCASMFNIKSCFIVHNKAKHKSKDILVNNVDRRKHSRVILNFTNNPNMKVLNITVSNVNIRQHDRASLRYTNNINMKVSKIYVSNVNIRQWHRDFLRLTNNLTMRCWIFLYPQSKHMVRITSIYAQDLMLLFWASHFKVQYMRKC